jgi:hypothetical protein
VNLSRTNLLVLLISALSGSAAVLLDSQRTLRISLMGLSTLGALVALVTQILMERRGSKG